MSKRIAFVINNNYFLDKTLAQLKTPDPDIRTLDSALRNPEIGNFDVVRKVTNESAQVIERHIKDLFHRRKRYDLLLLYLAGHILLNQHGQLYLAAASTRLSYLDETAVPATYLTDWMDRSFSRRQIIILDCYNSILPTQNSEIEPGHYMGLAETFKGRGKGRVVIAATDTVQYILAEDKITGQVQDSTFTHYFIQGLQTGAADIDQDGQVGLRELYDHTRKYVIHSGGQKPRRWTYREQDKFIIAHNISKRETDHRIKWNLIFGGALSPLVTLIIGGPANLSLSVSMASLFALLYIFLYSILD